MPLDDSFAHYAAQDRPLADPRGSAMARADAMIRAAGSARGRAGRAPVPFNPPLENLRYVLLLYAWCTRNRRDLVEHYRACARNAVRCYRALR